LHGRRSR